MVKRLIVEDAVMVARGVQQTAVLTAC